MLSCCDKWAWVCITFDIGFILSCSYYEQWVLSISDNICSRNILLSESALEHQATNYVISLEEFITLYVNSNISLQSQCTGRHPSGAMCHVIHFHVAIKLIDVEMITHYGHDGEGWPGAADITFNLNMFGQIADFGCNYQKRCNTDWSVSLWPGVCGTITSCLLSLNDLLIFFLTMFSGIVYQVHLIRW